MSNAIRRSHGNLHLIPNILTVLFPANLAPLVFNSDGDLITVENYKPDNTYNLFLLFFFYFTADLCRRSLNQHFYGRYKLFRKRILTGNPQRLSIESPYISCISVSLYECVAYFINRYEYKL